MDEPSCSNLQSAARMLCMSIIDSSLEFPDSKDRLFADSREFWPFNACIDRRNGDVAYAAGYLDAAKLLSRIVMFSRSGMDTLIYPIIYLYRHYLEMQLKALIVRGADIVDRPIDEGLERVLSGHNLMSLWNKFKPIFEEVFGEDTGVLAAQKGIESYLNQIHEIDPNSTTFRYHCSQGSGDHALDGIERINVLRFCQNMEKLTDLIEGIDGQLKEVSSYKHEMGFDGY